MFLGIRVVRVDDDDLDALAFVRGEQQYIAVSRSLPKRRLEAALSRELSKLITGFDGILIRIP